MTAQTTHLVRSIEVSLVAREMDKLSLAEIVQYLASRIAREKQSN